MLCFHAVEPSDVPTLYTLPSFDPKNAWPLSMAAEERTMSPVVAFQR